MKKSIILLSAAALVFAACQKEQSSPVNAGGLQLTATIEQQDCGDKTKTSLDENRNVLWSENDQVNVFTDAETPEKLTLTLASGAGTTSGTFTTKETPEGDPRYAIYPASTSNSINGSTITFTLPATQNYVENSFGNGVNVAVGKVSNGNVAYKNVCGVLKLSVFGNITVSKIELSGNNSEILCGTFTADASNVYGVATYSTGGGTTLTLDCGNGVALDVYTATAFYFVVPVGAFAGGFTATVYEKETSKTYEFSTTSSNVINRSLIKVMPTTELMVLPSEYQRVDYITNTGEQYIDTGIYGTGNLQIYLKASSSDVITNNTLFGCCNNNNWLAGEIGVFYIDGKFDVAFPTSNNVSSGYKFCGSVAASTVEEYMYDYTGFYQNGNLLCSCPSFYREYTCVRTLILPGYHRASIGGIPPLSIYKFSIKDLTDNLYDRLLYPCYRKSDSKPGMYDLVSGTFFTNAGSGEFTVGPDTD